MTNPAAPAATEPTARRHIGLLLFDDVEELDAVGPWEVLSYWTLHHPEDGWSISCISRDGQPIRAAKGLTLGAQHSFDTMPPLDVLIHPGGHGTRTLMRDSDHLAWIRGQRASVRAKQSWPARQGLIRPPAANRRKGAHRDQDVPSAGDRSVR